MAEDESLLYHDGSDNNYMRNKIRKLEKQGDSNDICQSSAIFAGCHIFVNGYTQPSRNEIKHLAHLHGGTFDSYQTSKTTHFICDIFPNAKINELRKPHRDKTCYVTTKWLTASIEAQRRLDEGLFLPVGLNNQHGGKLSFPRAPPNSTQQNHTSMPSSNVASAASAPTSSSTSSAKSTLSDPDFLQHYYTASRLHFIGSWKTRLPDILSELQPMQQEASRGDVPTAVFGARVAKRVVLHVDMDCFFVSALIRDKPHLQSVPVAVAHSRSGGSSEISSCNYPARAKGLKNGMMMSAAKDACPELVVLQYDFILYEKLSMDIYRIFFSHTTLVQPVSVDEAYLEFDSSVNGLEIGELIRNDIWTVTRCAASCGVGSNMLLARLATKKAKPNNQYEINESNKDEILAHLQLRDFPGIGSKHARKLSDAGYTTCKEALSLTRGELRGILGPALGESLWNMCRGIDARPLALVPVRKSIGADVNYGIRFEDMPAAEDFLQKVCVEVAQRLQKAKFRGKLATLKLMKRHPEASHETSKFLGHGQVDTVSKSGPCGGSTGAASAEELYNTAIILFRALTEFVPATDLRGVGLQISRLISVDTSSEISTDVDETRCTVKNSAIPPPSEKSIIRQGSVRCPSFNEFDDIYIPSQLDETVLSALPSPIQSKINKKRHMSDATSKSTVPLPDTMQFTQDFLSHMPPELLDEVKQDLQRTKAQRSQHPNTSVSTPPPSFTNLLQPKNIPPKRKIVPVSPVAEVSDTDLSEDAIKQHELSILQNANNYSNVFEAWQHQTVLDKSICVNLFSDILCTHVQWLVQSLQMDKGVLLLHRLRRFCNKYGNWWGVLLTSVSDSLRNLVRDKYGCDIDLN